MRASPPKFQCMRMAALEIGPTTPPSFVSAVRGTADEMGRTADMPALKDKETRISLHYRSTPQKP